VDADFLTASEINEVQYGFSDVLTVGFAEIRRHRTQTLFHKRQHLKGIIPFIKLAISLSLFIRLLLV